MASWTRHWDYLIVTASNAAQAQAYERQLDLRRRLGLLAGAGEVLVEPDPRVNGRMIPPTGSSNQAVPREKLSGKQAIAGSYALERFCAATVLYSGYPNAARLCQIVG